ncbi:MAG: DUF3098 domain-containing protein [Bacteroidota bacterium]|nr:DUF3098 domain-containing protein [Bacteroidota bacterium]
MADKKNEIVNDSQFAISKENYKFMLLGLGIIVVGFLLMIGGGSSDPNVFNKEMFSTQRITMAPLVVLAGFTFEIWAIMRKPKQTEGK